MNEQERIELTALIHRLEVIRQNETDLISPYWSYVDLFACYGLLGGIMGSLYNKAGNPGSLRKITPVRGIA